ncbi:hypothetical protein MHBO_000437 [Bonamia ostreae]|uniref:Uncharacterized protein n=1 Tax=Bonamia ostreae TaxID=126728 RepID=A0ABV2AGU3_9EUKA
MSFGNVIKQTNLFCEEKGLQISGCNAEPQDLNSDTFCKSDCFNNFSINFEVSTSDINKDEIHEIINEIETTDIIKHNINNKNSTTNIGNSEENTIDYNENEDKRKYDNNENNTTSNEKNGENTTDYSYSKDNEINFGKNENKDETVLHQSALIAIISILTLTVIGLSLYILFEKRKMFKLRHCQLIEY